MQRYLLILLLGVGVVATVWPAPFLVPVKLDWFMAATMLAVGAMLPRQEVRELAKRWPTVLFGTMVQYTAMPFLGWIVARTCGLPPAYQIGIVMVGCVPGAMASNVLTMNAGGNTSYSVGLTTSSTMLSPVVVPLLLKLTLKQDVQLDMLEVSLQLAWTVVVPVLTGFAIVQCIPRLEPLGNRWGPVIANICILWIISVVVAKNRQHVGGAAISVIMPLLVVNILGYAAGYFASPIMQLSEPMRRALTLEVGMQNAGLGTVLVTRLYPEAPEAMIPTAVYTIGCVITATLLAHFWRWRDRNSNSR